MKLIKGVGVTIDEINIPQATSSEFQITNRATGENYPLSDEVLIGREVDCTVRLQDPQIRRYHAKISVTEDGLFLEDLNSKNNTYLNGCRIGTGAWVTLSDEINFDGIKFIIAAASQPSNGIASDDIEHINMEDTFGFGTPINKSPVKAKVPEMPFSNQDVVEATRALEERAKARLQLFKESEGSGLNPDWEEFIAKRNAQAQGKKNPVSDSTLKVVDLKPSIKTNVAEIKPTNVTPIGRKTVIVEQPELSESSFKELDDAIAEASKEDDIEIQLNSTSSFTASDVTELLDSKHVPEGDESAPDGHLDFDISSDILLDDNADEDNVAQPIKPARKSTNVVSTGSGPRILAQTAPIRGKCYLLAATDAKKSWTIGKAKTADIQLSEDAIDLIHAHVELSNTGYKVRTTRATNGLLLNGKFTSEAKLKNGDVVQIGRIEFIYRDDDVADKADHPSEKKRKLNVGLIIGPIVVIAALIAAVFASPL